MNDFIDMPVWLTRMWLHLHANTRRAMRIARRTLIAFVSFGLLGVRGSPDHVECELFPIDLECGCIRTRKETTRTLSEAIVVDGRIFLIFRERETGEELFRSQVGFLQEDSRIAWWNYGLTREDDFNGDEKTDYAWYAGDDTSDEKLVFLSSPTGYRALDIYETLKDTWSRLYVGKGRLENIEVEGSEYRVESTRLRRSGNEVILALVIVHSAGWPNPEKRYPVLIRQSQFRYRD